MPTWLEYLEQAKAEKVGIAILCQSAETADSGKRQLYLARATARKEGNKTFDSLSISFSPHSDTILYLYHTKENSNEPPAAESLRTTSEAGDD